MRSFETGIPHQLCRIAHARGDAEGQSGVHRTSWSVFVYIKLGMEVGEGGKRVENKVKRKPTSVAKSAVFPRNWASFRPVAREKNSSCGLRFFGLLFMHMPLYLG